MQRQRARLLDLLAASIFVAAGAVIGAILADHQTLVGRVMASFIGAMAATAALSTILAFSRAVASLLVVGGRTTPPKLDPDWRGTGRRNIVRMHSYGEFIRRKAWLIAL